MGFYVKKQKLQHLSVVQEKLKNYPYYHLCDHSDKITWEFELLPRNWYQYILQCVFFYQEALKEQQPMTKLKFFWGWNSDVMKHIFFLLLAKK